MLVIHSARYHVDIGPHVFPTEKYQRVRDRLLSDRIVSSRDIVEPRIADWAELALVHTDEYLGRLRAGTLTADEVAMLELPCTPAMIDGFRLMTGGTIDAACLACAVPRLQGDEPVAGGPIVCHIGGGLHHAFPNHGEGFCPFNDVAVAIRVLQRRGIEHVAVIDCDVHHGNGTAFIFNPGGAAWTDPVAGGAGVAASGGDPRVFTFSIHQQHNYPAWKPRGALDVGLPDGAGDERFLATLADPVARAMDMRPECVFYLAGADPYEDDQLGGLRLTKDGLRNRDRLVIGTVARAKVPLVVLLAGGYARRVEDTVAIHAATIEEAAAAAPS